VVIIGLIARAYEPTRKRLFSYDTGEVIESPHSKISAYLTDASRLANPHLVVREVNNPINGAPRIIIGSKPIDGGHLIFDEIQREEFLRNEPLAEPYLRRYVGARELINGQRRWILALHNISPQELRQMPYVGERLELVRAFREQSTSVPTRALATSPTRFHVTVIPTQPFLVIPEASSVTREYVPIAYLEPPYIPSNLVRIQDNAPVWRFAVLTSRMNMAWLKEIGGRLKSDYRYSISIVYNNFPWPRVNDRDQQRLTDLGQAILDARAMYPDATLADLYDRIAMPEPLRTAHRRLDMAVERLYRSAPFENDVERVEHLLGLYERLSAPVLAVAQPVGRRRRRA
jgi:hypothetical protein